MCYRQIFVNTILNIYASWTVTAFETLTSEDVQFKQFVIIFLINENSLHQPHTLATKNLGAWLRYVAPSVRTYMTIDRVTRVKSLKQNSMPVFFFFFFDFATNSFIISSSCKS